MPAKDYRNNISVSCYTECENRRRKLGIVFFLLYFSYSLIFRVGKHYFFCFLCNCILTFN